MKLASSEARNATAFATSAASLRRPRDGAGELLEERVPVIRRDEARETRGSQWGRGSRR